MTNDPKVVRGSGGDQKDGITWASLFGSGRDRRDMPEPRHDRHGSHDDWQQKVDERPIP